MAVAADYKRVASRRTHRVKDTMPNRRISRDLKLASIRRYERGLVRLQDILECCEFSERTFYRILKLWRETGDVVNHSQGVRGRPRLLDREDIDYIIRLVRANPGYFLDELLSLVKNNRFISVHYHHLPRARTCRHEPKEAPTPRPGA